MKFEDLDQKLPNGLHDAQLSNMTIDYLKRTINLEMSIWIGDEQTLNKYRDGILTILDFETCAMDIPDKEYPFHKKGPLVIDAGPGEPKTSVKDVPIFDKESFKFWIWVNEWNGFIRIVAKDLEFNWT